MAKDGTPADGQSGPAPRLEQEDGRWWGMYGPWRITSHFQPIFSLTHRRAVGHEALLRAWGPGGPVSPAQVLSSGTTPRELVLLDRLCRAVHVHNFARTPCADQWLFLNVHPAVFAAGGMGENRWMSLSRETLGRFGIAPGQVVLEVTEDAIREEASFDAAVARAREFGCLLALDDFGAGHSNFDRVWRIRPDIVKLDRSVVAQAGREARIARVVTQMVSLLHECGAMVLVEGVETAQEADFALESDVDFVQGYYFAPPAPQLHPPGVPDAVDAVWARFDERAALADQGQRRRMAPYVRAMADAAARYAAGEEFASACAGFLALPDVELCFLIDEHGLQAAPNLTTARFDGRPVAFAPLADVRGARWSRRPYFRRAVEAEGRVHVTRPYLSVHGARLCLTVSVGIRRQGRLMVLGGDIALEPD